MKCSSFLQKMRLFVVSLCLLSIHLVVGEEVVVKTEKGSIKGASKDIDSGKKSFYEFKGIHYAKAPTGPLRFMVIKATFLIVIVTLKMCVRTMVVKSYYFTI